jgi:hypothetical protein
LDKRLLDTKVNGKCQWQCAFWKYHCNSYRKKEGHNNESNYTTAERGGTYSGDWIPEASSNEEEAGEGFMKEESDILSDDGSGKDNDDDEACGSSVKVTQVDGGTHSYLGKGDAFDLDSCDDVSESYMSSSGMKRHRSPDGTTPPTRMIKINRVEYTRDKNDSKQGR